MSVCVWYVFAIEVGEVSTDQRQWAIALQPLKNTQPFTPEQTEEKERRVDCDEEAAAAGEHKQTVICKNCAAVNELRGKKNWTFALCWSVKPLF